MSADEWDVWAEAIVRELLSREALLLVRLTAVGAREEQVRVVRELVPVREAERAALYGEGLPVGLRLVE